MKARLKRLYCSWLGHDAMSRLVMPVDGPPSVWMTWCRRCKAGADAARWG